MSRKKLSFSIPTKFEIQVLEELRESALKNQRSLSGEIRYRVSKTLQQKDADEDRSE